MAKVKVKRNHAPNEVRVMSIADFSHLGSLDAKVNEMVENRNEIVIHNIEYILKSRGIAQAKMCNIDLEGTPQPPQIAAYKQPGRDIPFRTIARIGLAYGYTPEQMVGQLLDKTGGRAYPIDKPIPRPADEYLKYVGTYHMAFFGTDAKLGGNKRTTARSLCTGMLSIYQGDAIDGVPTLKVVAFTNCAENERKDFEDSLKTAERSFSSSAVYDAYKQIASKPEEGSEESSRLKYFYEGEMILTERVAEITLRQAKGSDIVHIELHNRAANSSEGSSYKGGLATMMSTSRGEEHMPCIQALILSKRGFANIAKEELAQHLYMEAPTINIHDEVKSIIAYMKVLFPGEDGDSPLAQLAETDKAFMLESFIEKKLTEVIKRNVLGYYKISIEDDSTIYKAVCR